MTTPASGADSVAYVTVLSTDNYLDGVLVLDESLRRCHSRHPLYVLVGGRVTEPVRATLVRADIRSFDAGPVNVPEEVMQANLNSDYHRHWAGVFEKLLIFSLCQFRKIVFLDSDMVVLKNIDALFEKPHMSAVIADISPDRNDSVDLNAGLMVIEPEPDLTARLVRTIPGVFEQEKQWRMAAGRPPSMGVQSVINMFWDGWIGREDLHLHPKYNVFADHLDYYVRELNYRWRGPDGIHVVHYMGRRKPWMFSRADLVRAAARLLARRRVSELAALAAYRAVLASARLRLKRAGVARAA